MKRSEINQIMIEANEFFREISFKLPPWAFWYLKEWKANIDNTSEIVENMLGWDLTD